MPPRQPAVPEAAPHTIAITGTRTQAIGRDAARLVLPGFWVVAREHAGRALGPKRSWCVDFTQNVRGVPDRGVCGDLGCVIGRWLRGQHGSDIDRCRRATSP
jgi:hypothetical protein